jgi:hypothetical protein
LPAGRFEKKAEMFFISATDELREQKATNFPYILRIFHGLV